MPRHRGTDVTVAEPDDARPDAGYDGIVLGSGVYAGHWLKDAKNLATRIAATSTRPPVWVFSSGPHGYPPKPDKKPVDVAGIVEFSLLSSTGYLPGRSTTVIWVSANERS